MSSLLNIVRERFLEAVRSVEPGRWKALVVDEHSKKLLGNVLKNNDVLAEKVTVIDDISTYREPQPSLDGMYLLMPTTKNIDRLISDYSNGKQQYKAAHLFFIDGLPEDLFTKLTSSPAEPFLATLQELYINFWAIEAQAFSVKLPSLFFSLYSPPRNPKLIEAEKERLHEDLRFASKMIADLCITLREYPYIRYYIPMHHPPLGVLSPTASLPASQPNATPAPSIAASRWKTSLAKGENIRQFEAREKEYATKILAWMVQDALDDYKKANPDFPKSTDGQRQRSTLLITDRTMDTLAPFVHEFTYQAMANELLHIEDGVRYTYKFQSTTSPSSSEIKTAVLSDSDSVWTDVRHMHMSEAIEKLKNDFNKFLQENAGFKGDGVASLNDMKDMLASLPQYQEQREKFSVHLNMAQECMDIFEKRKLPAVATIEQNCATGLTADKKPPKTLVEQMVPLLDSKEVTNKDKVRIIALYIQHREGVPDEDRRRLYQHARLTLPEQDAVNGLVHLGARISRGPADKDIKGKLRSRPPGDEEFELSRYKPVLQTVIEDQISNKLDTSIFPYVKDTPLNASTTAALRAATSTPTPTESLRSQKPSWHRAAKPGVTNGPVVRQRLIVFVAGGMTYSEMRTAYQLSASLGRDIYIGSSHITTPDSFLDDLKVVDLGGVGSHAIPNGLHNREAHSSFQEYYDEMYYTKDPPPPPSLPKAQQPSSRLAEKVGLPVPGGRPILSASNSTSSAISGAGSTKSSVLTKEKKKKGGFFHF